MAQNTSFFFGTFLIVLSISILFGKVVASDCLRTKTYEYKGHQQTTKDGQTCIRWDSFDHKYSNPDKFTEATTSEDENYCRDPDRHGYLWCYVSSDKDWGKCDIDKCDTVDVKQCGSLKIEQPTILGRNVTFTFTPETTSDADLDWQRANERNVWGTLPNHKKFTQYFQNGTYYLVLTDTVRDYDELFYRVGYTNNSVSCLMKTPKLQLQDISSYTCGFVYLRTTKVKEGENVELEYYPSEYVNQYPEHIVRQWMHSTDQPVSITLTKDVYEEEREPNDKYVLTIIMFNDRMNGRYGVYCGGIAGYSNMVKVILPVAPSTPAFEGLKDIDDCKGCIVGEDGDQFSVLCKTSGGTQPIKVTMSIGNESLSPQRYNDTAGYKAFFTLLNRHHMAIMTCTVMNDALTSSFIITAHVYVIKSPIFHLFMVPGILKEGETVNITCVVKNGRPAPKVHMKVSDTEVPSAVQTDYFNSSTSLNTNAVTMTTFEPIWNRENITCCRYSEWYKITSECSPPKQVTFLYSPVIEFNISGSVLNISEGERTYVKCSVKSLRTFNISWVEHTDDGNMYQKHCHMKTDCLIVIDACRISQRHLNCQASSLQTTDKKTLTVNIYEKAEQRFNNQDTTGFRGNSFIWIIISSCSTAILIGVFTACLVTIKKMKTAKAKWETKQVRHRANVGGTRNDVELEVRAYEDLNDARHATGQLESTYSQLSP
ncbi:uncharacterized protein LOC128546179 isoform X2 [Mercenaria mercenaria]|uniref:uncharacterized protein LOC128546179 isoform X2 n=1 Tax=Mercenaria mercenaria TaxID=6596 RepID=UPI00234F0C31|nr:uncharacterized protein LOC128546179 isoform X2 [Mercenaria mercenaria]